MSFGKIDEKRTKDQKLTILNLSNPSSPPITTLKAKRLSPVCSNSSWRMPTPPPKKNWQGATWGSKDYRNSGFILVRAGSSETEMSDSQAGQNHFANLEQICPLEAAKKITKFPQCWKGTRI